MKKFGWIGFLLYSAQSKPFLMCEFHQGFVILAFKGFKTALLINMLCAGIAVQHAQRQTAQMQMLS